MWINFFFVFKARKIIVQICSVHMSCKENVVFIKVVMYKEKIEFMKKKKNLGEVVK